MVRLGWASLVALTVKNLPATQETRLCSLGWEDPLEGGNGLPTPGFLPGKSHGQRSLMGYSPWVRRVRYYWVTNTYTHKIRICSISMNTEWFRKERYYYFFFFSLLMVLLAGVYLLNEGMNYRHIWNQDCVWGGKKQQKELTVLKLNLFF